MHSKVAPCKGIHDSLGFWIPTGLHSEYWIPDSSSVDSGFHEGLDSKFFFLF